VAQVLTGFEHRSEFGSCDLSPLKKKHSSQGSSLGLTPEAGKAGRFTYEKAGSGTAFTAVGAGTEGSLKWRRNLAVTQGAGKGSYALQGKIINKH
jgi:hypothetical protein